MCSLAGEWIGREYLYLCAFVQESTNSASVISKMETTLADGTPVYIVEYYLDSTRGTKRVITSVTITKRKLFIANATLFDSPSEPVPSSLLQATKKIVNSFSVID